MKSLQGRAAIVTGASRGIGLAIARRLVDDVEHQAATVARTIEAFLASDDASWMTGQILVVDGGLTMTGGV